MIRVDEHTGTGPITIAEYNRLVKAVRECQNMSVGPGLELRRTASGALISATSQSSQQAGMAAKITDYTYVAEYNAYEYDWDEAYVNPLGTDGYDTWIVKPGGKNSDDDGLARNHAEYGFGHIEGGDARTFATQPVVPGALVFLTRQKDDEWWFDRDVSSEHGLKPAGSVSLGSSVTVVSSTADTATFDYTDDDGKGCSVCVLTGVYYDSAAHKFWAKYRALSFDGGGRLHEASAETAAEIVALAECEPEA